MLEWISVKERMPETEGKYIVCTAKGSVYCTKFKGCGDTGVFKADMNTHITHWMPLPPCPEEYNKTIVFSKKKWMECKLPEDVREDSLQSGWVDVCDGKPVKNGQCGHFLIVDTWCVDADKWEAYDDA